MTTTIDNEPGFLRVLLTSFRYPTQGNGLYIIVGGAVVFTIADLISAHAGMMAIFIQAGISGYLASYAKDVMRTSAMGESNPPGWVDFSDWLEDLVVPAFQFLLALALAFGVYIFLRSRPPFHGHVQTAALLISAVWGCAVWPILSLGLAMTDSAMAVLNPIPLARAIWITLPDYLMTCCLCVVVLGAGFGLHALKEFVPQVPVLPDLVVWLCSLYLMTALMRGFGLFYRCNHERLQWY